MHRRLITLSCLLLALIFSITGCLDAKKESAVSYDPKTDTFTLLKVYYHIHASNPDELAYLTALYDNRREIIPADVLAILEESAYLRLDAKNYYTISLGEAKPKPQSAESSPIDLNTLGNKPGHFFLTDQGTLAYYHQIEIPGPFADALLTQANAALNKAVIDGIAAEMKRRDKGGDEGKIASWDALRLEITENPPASQPGAAPSKPSLKDNPVMCLDTESLALLLNAANEKRPILLRRGTTVTATVEISAADRRQFLVTWDTLKKKAAEDAAKPDANNPNKKSDTVFTNILDLIKITNGGPAAGASAGVVAGNGAGNGDAGANRITASANFLEAQAAVEKSRGADRFAEKPDPSMQADYNMTLEIAKAHNIPIDKNLKLADILPRFKKGDLPVDAGMNVPLGQGLFAPATQPAQP